MLRSLALGAALTLALTPSATAEQQRGARPASTGAAAARSTTTARPAANGGAAPAALSQNVSPGVTSAPPAEAPVNAAAVLAKSYEDRAKEALESYVPQREFLISVEVMPGNKPLPKAAPYEPRSFSPGSSLNMTIEEMDSYVSRVSIEVALSERLQSSRRRIEDLLAKVLQLKRNRGDRVSFTALGIELDDDDWKKEKVDLKREIEVLKSENNRLNGELANKNRDPKSQPSPESMAGDPNSLKNQEWFLPALVGGAALLLLIGLFSIGRGFFGAGRKMGDAISNVASSLERIGGALNTTSGGAGGGGGGIQSLEAKLLSEGGKGGLSSLPLNVIHAHLAKIQAEILEAMNEGTQSIILRHITQLLNRPETIARAVVTLELLGRDLAANLFKSLGLRSQEIILVFLRQGLYAGSKIELMLEAAEDLKTKLLVESLERVKGKPSEKVAQRLVQITDEELAQVSLEMDTESLPRLFLYLEPQKVSALIAAMKRLNPDRYAEALTVLSKLPEASQTDSYDDNIVVALDTVIDRTKNDAQRPFLKVYQDIVESAEEEVGEQIVRELSQDPRVDEYFRQNVITINTFFVLPEDQRNELLDTLSNKDIAALALGVKPEEQQLLLDAVPARRKSMVAEEFESLQARGQRNITVAFKKVRESIVKRLKEMKADGSLVTAASTESAGAARGGEASSAAPAPDSEATSGGSEEFASSFTNAQPEPGAEEEPAAEDGEENTSTENQDPDRDAA